MASRPRTSGKLTVICRSKRPGRRRAGSNTSGRLVAAMMMMPSVVSKPSISTSNALSVCSRSSLPPPKPWPRLRPTASISSMKIRQGVFLRACSNMSRTRLAPTPTNISTKSEPLMLKKAASASPAMALASHFDLADKEEPDEQADHENGTEAVNQAQQHCVRLFGLKKIPVQQHVFHAIGQAHLGHERDSDRLAT